jgi:methionyl-tRNA formyltransferase
MRRLFFVVNRLEDVDFSAHLEKHLPEYPVDVGTSLPPAPEQYRLIVLWSYRKIIRPLPQTGNIVLFHSSDLPKDRGWAPIYHALAGRETHYTISGIFAADEVDAGDLIVKARFPILAHYTAADLRRFDAEISIILVREMLGNFSGRRITGVPQRGVPTYRNRRAKEENGIDIEKPFVDLIPHLRACERDHPAFFHFDGARYFVYVQAAEPAEFPTQVAIEFAAPDNSQQC